MTDLELRIDDEVVAPATGVRLDWLDRDQGLARLHDGRRSRLVAVEGEGSDWAVTIDGRRVPVTARTWRERTLAAAERATAAHGGPVDVKATLPGMVVAVQVVEGDEVVEGQGLLTIEAMKMQNEVRAPRSGRVSRVAIGPGTAVATGALLIRLDD
jgi:biotin carboxyl carrier protein